MPGSRPDARPWVTAQAVGLQPASICDVGAGAGTYWSLLRRKVKARWTAVEIWEPYVQKYALRRKYDRVLVGDFLELDVEPHDLLILGDVLEHVELTMAVRMLAKATGLGNVIVVVPIDNYAQGSVNGNQHETHHWHPTHDMMMDLTGAVDCWSNGRKGAYLIDA